MTENLSTDFGIANGRTTIMSLNSSGRNFVVSSNAKVVENGRAEDADETSSGYSSRESRYGEKRDSRGSSQKVPPKIVLLVEEEERTAPSVNGNVAVGKKSQNMYQISGELIEAKRESPVVFNADGQLEDRVLLSKQEASSLENRIVTDSDTELKDCIKSYSTRSRSEETDGRTIHRQPRIEVEDDTCRHFPIDKTKENVFEVNVNPSKRGDSSICFSQKKELRDGATQTDFAYHEIFEECLNLKKVNCELVEKLNTSNNRFAVTIKYLEKQLNNAASEISKLKSHLLSVNVRSSPCNRCGYCSDGEVTVLQRQSSSKTCRNSINSNGMKKAVSTNSLKTYPYHQTYPASQQPKLLKCIVKGENPDEVKTELAILHDTNRQSTVISRELIELLCISKEDFIDIFMAAGGVKNINDPDHADFLLSLEFLRGWPTEELPKNPKKCLFNFFRRGAVLVRDSNYSDWIYIVKSGSCQVLKKLKKVKSKLNQSIKCRDDDSNLTLEKLHDLAVDMARKKRHQLLDRHYSAIETVASVQDNWGGMIEPPLSQMSPSRSSNKSRVTFATGSAESMNENDIGLSRGKYRSLALYRSAGKLPRRTTETDLEELKRNRDDFDIDLGNKDLSGSRSTPPGSTSPGSEKSMLGTSRMSSLNLKRHRSNMYIQTPSANQAKRELESPQHKLAIIDEAAKKHEETAEVTEADIDPCFVQVAILQKGDVFGLHSIFCDGQPSLSLVSNGAECIMILKKFYLEHCTESMKRKLRKWVSPYPDDLELQSSLQDKVNWDSYRSQTLGESLRSTRIIRRLRDKCAI